MVCIQPAAATEMDLICLVSFLFLFAKHVPILGSQEGKMSCKHFSFCKNVCLLSHVTPPYYGV